MLLLLSVCWCANVLALHLYNCLPSLTLTLFCTGKSLNIDTHSGDLSPGATTNNNNNTNATNVSGIMKLSPLQSAAHLPFSPLLPLTYSNTTNSSGNYNNEVSLGPLETQMSSAMRVNTAHTAHTTHTTHNAHASHATHTNNAVNNSHNTSNNVPAKPVLTRSVSHNASMESYRQTIAEIISQIRYDHLSHSHLLYFVTVGVHLSHISLTLIAYILSFFRRYDPYPCILGIPIMPALFNSSKFYIFVMFTLLGIRTMVACLRQL